MQSFKQNPAAKTAQNKYKGFYRQKNYNINNYWMPGQAVTEKDSEMLLQVKTFYRQHGYTPTKEDVGNAPQLKARFRTWNNVLLAAGLPDKNDPENQKKRMESKRQNETADSSNEENN